jgi:hypothetical protein
VHLIFSVGCLLPSKNPCAIFNAHNAETICTIAIVAPVNGAACGFQSLGLPDDLIRVAIYD